MTTESLGALLELQDHDTHLDQLRHRRRALAELAERDEARDRLVATRDRARAVADRRDELIGAQRRLQDETATLDERRRGHSDKLYDGSVTNPRELQDLQAEVEALDRRIADIEDRELEVMEELEPVEAELADLANAEATQGGELDDAEAALTVAEAEIDAEIATTETERGAVAERIDVGLLDEYRQIRAGRGGIAVARLSGDRCGACQLTVSKMAIAAVKKHPDQVQHCEECGSILLP